jgi:hypothetical protein
MSNEDKSLLEKTKESLAVVGEKTKEGLAVVGQKTTEGLIKTKEFLHAKTTPKETGPIETSSSGNQIWDTEQITRVYSHCYRNKGRG